MALLVRWDDAVCRWLAAAAAAGLGVAAFVLVRRLSAEPARGVRTAAIVALGTAVPAHACSNAGFKEVTRSMGYPPGTLALVDKIVAKAGIETRHTAVSSDVAGFAPALLRGGRARAEVWEAAAPVLALAAARDALSRWAQGDARDVTHIVVHSCTGFAAPGLDCALIKGLGLPNSTRKVPVHFAGCFGGFTALYVAQQIIEANGGARAVVLVVAAEVCTAHMACDERTECVIGNTIFADGAGAAVVTAVDFRGASGGGGSTGGPWQNGRGLDGTLGSDGQWVWAFGGMASDLIPDTEQVAHPAPPSRSAIVHTLGSQWQSAGERPI
jgi:hypothetical protein